MKDQIERLIRKYERQLGRSHKRESDLEGRKNLSKHGYWDLGYFSGKTSLYEDVIDDLKSIVGEVTDQSSE